MFRLIVLICVFLIFIPLISFEDEPYSTKRENMVKYQIEERGTKDTAVLRL